MLRVLYYVCLEIAIVFTLYVYSDFNIQWLTYDEEVKFLHLLFTVPLFLLAAFVIVCFDRRDTLKGMKAGFVIFSFCLITLYMFAAGGSLEQTKIEDGVVLTLALWITSLGFIAYEIKRFRSLRGRS